MGSRSKTARQVGDGESEKEGVDCWPKEIGRQARNGLV